MGPQRMFGMTPWVRRLMVANLLVYLLQVTVFVDPRFIASFGFDPLGALARPWTFLTYMFLHAGVLHLAFNMLALFVFGPRVEERLGGRAFLTYYLACGLGGAALSYVLMLVVPVPPMVGASGAIYGVMLAFAWAWPDQGIFIFPFPEPIPAKWLVTFAVGISLVLALLSPRDGIAHLAHLGGIAAGFVYLKSADWRLSQAEQRLRRGAEPSVLVHPAARIARGSDPAVAKPRRPAPDRTQAEIDRVLDKISASGMASLTPAERKFLTEMSRKMRDRD
ncbi:MAG: rhomboid family intramembrane serine protease [Gemmatimonadetes bacterium]|nr:rhomboid family intramembrane serine protease [Gemmatimonadota bacterium]